MPVGAAVPLALVLLAAALHVLGERRAAPAARPSALEPRPLARGVLLRRARDDPRRAGLADRRSLREALLGPHDPARAAADGRRAADRARRAVEFDVAAAARSACAARSRAQISRSRACAPLRALGHLLARPAPAWIAFNANLVLWHIPAIYAHAIGDGPIHDLEHTTFLLFGVLLWAQVIDSPPLRARLSAALAGRLRRRHVDRQLGALAGHHLRVLAAVRPLRGSRASPGRHLGARRPADRRRRDARARIDRGLAVRVHRALPLDRAATSAPTRRAMARRRRCRPRCLPPPAGPPPRRLRGASASARSRDRPLPGDPQVRFGVLPAARAHPGPMTTSLLIIINVVFDLAAVVLLTFVMTRAGRLQRHSTDRAATLGVESAWRSQAQAGPARRPLRGRRPRSSREG